MNVLLSFIYSHFFEGLVIAAFAAFSKVLINYFGNDRTQKIKDTILTSMLWAEEQFGIGTGDQKWTVAWNKLVELLEKQGIKIKKNELAFVTDLMKSNVPEINALVYNTLPEKSKETRELRLRTPETIALVNSLKKKYPNPKKGK